MFTHPLLDGIRGQPFEVVLKGAKAHDQIGNAGGIVGLCCADLWCEVDHRLSFGLSARVAMNVAMWRSSTKSSQRSS